VGYRKQVRGAKWLTKRKVAGRYAWEYLGIADDFMQADGQVVLTYSDAVKLAQERASAMCGARPRYHGDAVTVNSALDAHFAERRRSNPASTAISGDEQQATRHIRSRLGQ
jgi:hypothetical protein